MEDSLLWRDLDSFAKAIELSTTQLTRWSHFASQPSAYSNFQIPKRSGGTRTISAPTGGLRTIQRRILRLLETLYRPRPCVNGFVKRRSIVSNATPHVRSRHVLNIDIQEFFQSINFGRVRGALIAKPFSIDAAVATVIARICCRDNQLPQGAPTSPILANMVCMRLDGEMMRLAKAFGCMYTRYADDMTLSTNRRTFPSELAVLAGGTRASHALAGPNLISIFASNGFNLNALKSRLYSRNQAQRVTGLTVNMQVNVQRTFVRELRAMIHAWRKYGLENVQLKFIESFNKHHRRPGTPPSDFRNVLRGKLMFLGMVRGFTDSLYIGLARQCRELEPLLFSEVLDRDEALLKNIWVLECEQSMIQGTAFFLEDVGLVTCEHVLGPATVAFHPSNPGRRFPAVVHLANKKADVAILNIGMRMKKPLALGDPKALTHNSRLWVAGYPNYGEGDSLYRAVGNLSSRRIRNGTEFLIPSFQIASGNSGGPVIDEQYRVVGVAAKGVADFADEVDPDRYGAISIKHVLELAASRLNGAEGT